MILSAHQFRKLGNAHSPSIELKEPVGAFISLLLSMRSPSAILLGITEIIVDSVYRMTRRRTLSHILQKTLKGLPLLTNSEISLGIFSCFKRLIAGSPRFEIVPATVCSGLSSTSPTLGLTVLCLCFGYHLHCFAAAGFGASLTQCESRDWLFHSAVALAQPNDVAVDVLPGLSKYYQIPKTLTGDVFDVGMERRITNLGFIHDLDDMDSSEDHLAATGGPCAFIMDETSSKSTRRTAQW